MQHRRRIDRRSRRVDFDQFAQPVEQRTGHLDSDPDPIGLTDTGERTLDLTTQVPRDPVGGLCNTQRSLVGWQRIRERFETGLQALRYENFVQTLWQLLHGSRNYGLALARDGTSRRRARAWVDRGYLDDARVLAAHTRPMTGRIWWS